MEQTIAGMLVAATSTTLFNIAKQYNAVVRNNAYYITASNAVAVAQHCNALLSSSNYVATVVNANTVAIAHNSVKI